MTDNQKAAFVYSQAINALIDAFGMQAENQHRLDCGKSIAYGDDAFFALKNEYAIDQNSVIQLFHGG